jgi:hypothetical protein
VWLPARFEGGGVALDWVEEWDLGWFDRKGGATGGSGSPAPGSQ